MSKFSGITKAALEISYDNGGIHRYRSERSMRQRLSRFIAAYPLDRSALSAIDSWLLSLPDAEFEIVCIGAEHEAEAITMAAPPFTNQILNDIFEMVS